MATLGATVPTVGPNGRQCYSADAAQGKENFHRYQAMPPEHRQKLRERFRDLTPDQRKRLQDRMTDRRPKPTGARD